MKVQISILILSTSAIFLQIAQVREGMSCDKLTVVGLLRVIGLILRELILAKGALPGLILQNVHSIN